MESYKTPAEAYLPSQIQVTFALSSTKSTSSMVNLSTTYQRTSWIAIHKQVEKS
ncbi:hypothetical protein GBAR_LOCUS12159, partial [Geodia barretti]